MVRLSHVAHIEMGQSPPSSVVSESSDRGIPFLQGSAEFTSRCPQARQRCTTPPKLAEAGDVLISVRAPVGAINRADQTYCIGRGLAAVRFTEVDAAFGFHALALHSRSLRRVAQGSTFEAVGGADLRALEVPLLPCAEQRLIAKILDTIDEAIRKTEDIITKLSLIKDGLLHDLLVRGIDETGALRPCPHDAPRLYQRSPLGSLPADWQVRPLSSWLVGGPKNGYSACEVEGWTGTLVLGLGCLTPDGFSPLQLKSVSPHDVNLKRALLHDGDLLISRSNTRELVGMVGVYRDVGMPCLYPDLMMRLSPTGATSAVFLEVVLRSQAVRAQLQAAASGTSGSMVKINSTILRNVLVPMPPLAEQQRILAASTRLSGRIGGEHDTAQKLKALRTGLLEDLLSGRVRTAGLAEVAE